MSSFVGTFHFWIAVAIAAAITLIVMRPLGRRRVAPEPKALFRSPLQRVMHYLAIVLITLPLCYVVVADGAPFWATFSVLGVQAGAMAVLRTWGVGFVARARLLVPVAAASVLVGALVEGWPDTGFSALGQASWPYLMICGMSISLGSLLSLYSFPLGQGDRTE